MGLYETSAVPLFNVIVPGKPRCDDWVELDEALDQAAAFLGLGTESIIIRALHPQPPSRGQSATSSMG